MNEERRKKLSALKAQLSDIQNQLDEIKDDEQGAFEDLSKNLQSGEKGERMQSALSTTLEAVSYRRRLIHLEEASSNCEIAADFVESAISD